MVARDSLAFNDGPSSSRTESCDVSEKCVQESFGLSRLSTQARMESSVSPQVLDFNEQDPYGSRRLAGFEKYAQAQQSSGFDYFRVSPPGRESQPDARPRESHQETRPRESQPREPQPRDSQPQVSQPREGRFQTNDNSGFDFFKVATPAREFQLHQVERRRDLPNATVYIPPGFDSSKPVNVIIYNHGRGNTANGDYRAKQLREQMDGAPPNSILVVPAWQRSEGADNNNVDPKLRSGFVDMISQAVKQTGKNLNDVGSLQIISHSGGYVPANVELGLLKSTPLYDRITSVASLDSLYERLPGVDEWIGYNIQRGRFASGQASYTNVFSSDGSPKQVSIGQARDVASWTGNPNLIGRGFNDGRRNPANSEAGKYPLAFLEVKTDHGEVPTRHFRKAVQRIPRPRDQGTK